MSNDLNSKISKKINYCIDCDHRGINYTQTIIRTDICKYFTYNIRDPVTGIKAYDLTCRKCRSDENLCGYEGRHFKQKVSILEKIKSRIKKEIKKKLIKY